MNVPLGWSSPEICQDPAEKGSQGWQHAGIPSCLLAHGRRYLGEWVSPQALKPGFLVQIPDRANPQSLWASVSLQCLIIEPMSKDCHGNKTNDQCKAQRLLPVNHEHHFRVIYHRKQKRQVPRSSLSGTQFTQPKLFPISGRGWPLHHELTPKSAKGPSSSANWATRQRSLLASVWGVL